MSELLTIGSFIVRIYRVDTEDRRKLTGLVEAMDGSGERTSFAGIDELAAILNRGVNGPQRRRRQRIKPG